MPTAAQPGGGAGHGRAWWCLLLALLLGRPARAQLVVGATRFAARPALAPRPDTAVLLLARARRVGLNTFVQSSGARGHLVLGPRQQLRYRLGSEWIYDNRGTPPFVREDYAADLAYVYALVPDGRWQLGQQLHYDQSRANATRTGLWLGRLGYQRPLRPRDSLSVLRVVGLAGLATDARNGRRDAGFAYGFDALVLLFRRNAPLAPLALRLLGTRARLAERTVQRLVAEASGEQAFLPNAALLVQARAGYRQNRAEDYLGGSVQRIQSDTVAGQLGGSYRITPFATLRTDNSVLLPVRSFGYRRLSAGADTLQDVGYRQQEYDTRQELRLVQPTLQAGFIFSYHERNRAYYLDNSRNFGPARLATALAREQAKDVTEQTTRYQADLTWLPAPRHALALLGTAQLLRVDAPSRDNQQTRDEAQHLLRLTWTGRWAGTFRTTLGVAAEYRQTVFIRAAQSAENYADRLLHYEPGFTWAVGRLSLRSQYHLWVSYQVRDRSTEQARNRASRVLETTQSLGFQLTPTLALQADYSRRENRIGQLVWPAFRESPLDTSLTHDLSAGLRRTWAGPHGSSSLRLGYRLLEQRNYGRALLLPAPGTAGPSSQLIFLHGITRQQGPELAAERRATAGLNVVASLWLQWLRTYSTYTPGTGSTASGSSYTATDLAVETRRLLPYFELSVEWRVGRR